MAERECLVRPGKLERRASEIGEAVRKEILRVAQDQKIGDINVEISVLNNGVGHCKISHSRPI